MTTKYFLEKNRREFIDYFNTKLISPTIGKKFISALDLHIRDNKESFVLFCEFIQNSKGSDVESVIISLNTILSKKIGGYKTIQFVADFSSSYLGTGEILLLLSIVDSISGGKRYPDIIFKNSDKRIEVKAYAGNFRLTESTYFFTDLGTIIQALVQGGFLTSLTDINNNDLRKGLRHFSESFLVKRGFIELNSQIWKLEYKNEERMVFKASPETQREVVQYSIVRNSIRNWLTRGLLSLKLINIIDPTRTTKIHKTELNNYISNLLGLGNLTPIPLEQYFGLCSLDSIILYENKNKEEPFQIIKYDDLKKFMIYRVGQSKVSYKKLDPKSI